jgi:hypothetical protein
VEAAVCAELPAWQALSAPEVALVAQALPQLAASAEQPEMEALVPGVLSPQSAATAC